MRKVISISLCAVILIFCGCNNSAEETVPSDNVSITETSQLQTSTQGSGKSYIDYSAGGLNYSCNDSQPLIYNGESVVMKVKIDSNTPYECCMGVCVFVDGIPHGFTMRQCSDENFDEYVSETSEEAFNHQIIFPATDGYTAAEEYFEISFEPNMFEKGCNVLANVVCTVNDDYYPESTDNIIPMATSVFSIFPPEIQIKTDKTNGYKVCKNYTVENMAENYSDANDNGFPKFEVNITEEDKNAVRLQIKGHTINDPLLEKGEESLVRLCLLVNGKPYAAFDGCTSLEIPMNINTYYIYDVTLKKSELNPVNRIQLVGFEIDHKNGNNLIAPDAVFVKGCG